MNGRFIMHIKQGRPFLFFCFPFFYSLFYCFSALQSHNKLCFCCYVFCCCLFVYLFGLKRVHFCVVFPRLWVYAFVSVCVYVYVLVLVFALFKLFLCYCILSSMSVFIQVVSCDQQFGVDALNSIFHMASFK